MQDQNDTLNDGIPSISLREYGDILRRRRMTILQTFLLVLVAGIIVTLVLPPTYRAKARLLVEAPQFGITQMDGSSPLVDLYRPNQMYSVQTQVELLQAADMRKKVQKDVDGPLPAMSVEQVPPTQIIEVTAEGDNAERVAQAPNALLTRYVSDIGDKSKGELEKAIIKVNDGIRREQKKLDDTEGRLQKFKQTTKVVELAANSQVEQVKVSDLTAKFEGIQSEILSNQAETAQLAAELRQMRATTLVVPSQLSDPAIQSLESGIASQEAAVAALREEVTPENTKLRAAEAQLLRYKQELARVTQNFAERNKRVNPAYEELANKLAAARVVAAGLQAKSNQVEDDLRQARTRLSRFPEWQTELTNLERNIEQAKLQYGAYAQMKAALELRKETRKINAQIIERAEVPTIPIRPQHAQQIAFSAILGLFLGLCLALLQEFLDDRVNSPDEADRILRLPNLGHIPVIEEEGLRLIRDIDTFSPVLESYRSLRTNINFAAVGNPVRSLVVTSSGPGEGKSTTTANLAMAMALNGKRVIVVDADLRRPSQHKLFNISVAPGLTDILVGTHTIGEVIRPTNVDKVSIIPAGSVPPNPAELIGSASMAHFIAALRATADIILIDSPPVLAVADAVLLSSRVDGVLLVLGFGETRKSQAKQARDLLARARANVLGTILNKIDNNSSGYYYGKYYLPTNEAGAMTTTAAAAGSGTGAATALSGNGFGTKKNGVGGYVNGTEGGSNATATAALPADTTRAGENGRGTD